MTVATSTQAKKAFKLDFNKLQDLIETRVYHLVGKYHPSRRLPTSDIAWDCFTTLWSRNFFAKYDSAKATKNTYIWNGVQNFLIDQERQASSRLKPVSLDKESLLGTSMYDLVDEVVSQTGTSMDVYLDIIQAIHPTTLGVKLATNTKKVTLAIGEFVLCPYSVLYLTLSGYNMRELSELYKVSPSYISTLHGEALQLVKENVVISELETSITPIINKCDSTVIWSDTCPHCASTRTGLWESDTWSGLDYMICKDCDRTFTEYTGTPLGKKRNKGRIQWLELCLLYTQEGDVFGYMDKNDVEYATGREYLIELEQYMELHAYTSKQMVHKLTKWKGTLLPALLKQVNYENSENRVDLWCRDYIDQECGGH